MKRRIVFVLSFAFVICLVGCSRESASIGIIGGADGPTAIFVTSHINWPLVCGIVAVIVAAVFVVFFILRKKK